VGGLPTGSLAAADALCCRGRTDTNGFNERCSSLEPAKVVRSIRSVTQYTPHHPGDRLAATRIEREQSDLAKAYAEVMRQQRVEQIAQADRAAKVAQAERITQFEKAERVQGERMAEAREKIREQRERERGRDDRGRGR